MRLRTLRNLTIATSVGISALASATACNPGEDPADGRDTSPVESEADSAYGAPILDAVPARMVRIGSNWVDKPSAFLDASAIETYRSELTKAANNNSAEFAFVVCEARGAQLETTNQTKCASKLEKERGYSLEFVVRAFDENHQRCGILSSTCRPHQAIRVRSWADGIRRPALFVEKRPLSDEEMTMVVLRPDIDTNQGAVTITPGFTLDSEIGARVASDLGYQGESFLNLTHISNKWTEKDKAIRLNRARAQAFAIVSLPLGGAGVAQGLAVLRGGATITTIARALAVLSVAASVTGIVSSGVDLFGIRQLVQTLPKGSAEERTLATAILVANIAPYLGGVSLGAHLARGAATALLRARAIQELAKQRGVAASALGSESIARVARGADEASDEVALLFIKGQRENAANRIKEFTDRVVARFDALRPTSERPWVPSGSNVEGQILEKQKASLGEFRGFVSGWSQVAGIEKTPVGVRAELQKGYQEIIDFMHDSNRFYARMQQLEAEVAKRVASKGETSEKALDAILGALERKHKFAPLKEIKVLDQNVISSGTPFVDLGFSAYQSHGRQVHRIQWNLLLREMDTKPTVFDDIPGVEYYKEFGSSNIQGMSWNKPWDDLFDSRGIKSPTCPERMRDVGGMLPQLGKWE